VFFQFEPLASISPIEVTATAFNYTPYLGTVNVVANEFPFLVYHSNELNDLQGNNNQLADYGETASLRVRVRNVGTPLEAAITGSIQTSSPWVELLNPGAVCTFSTEAGTEILLSEDCFSFVVSDNVPDQTLVIFEVMLSDGEGMNWTVNVPVTIQAPAIRITNYLFSEISGNGNNRPDSGETINLTFTVMNQGHSPAQAGEGLLVFEEAYVENLSMADVFSALPEGDSQMHSYTFQLNQNIPPSAVLPFEYTASYVNYSDSEFGQMQLNLIVEDWEAENGFDWAISASNPWAIDNSTAYEGNYSMKSGNISDNQFSELLLTFEASESGNIGFFRKVSSEEGWDFLRFYIDDVEYASWSGNLDWEEFSYPVSAGVHTFRWEYRKDDIISDFMDAAWVDFITLPPAEDATFIHEAPENLAFSLYPNPAHGILHLVAPDNAEPQSMQLFDTSGRMVFESLISQKHSVIQLPANLGEGLYFVALNTTQSRGVQKIMLR
jgi:hypothetical protein